MGRNSRAVVTETKGASRFRNIKTNTIFLSIFRLRRLHLSRITRIIRVEELASNIIPFNICASASALNRSTTTMRAEKFKITPRWKCDESKTSSKNSNKTAGYHRHIFRPPIFFKDAA